jgi:hypothetical protein
MRLRLFALSLVFCATGCGDNLVSVSGKVTLDDKPLRNATVIFHPDSDKPNPGPGSHGKTNDKGEYSLSLMTRDVKGAVPGKHKVSITAYEGDDKVPSSGSDMVFRKPLLPDKYNGKTILTFDVPAGGTATADFPLTTR